MSSQFLKKAFDEARFPDSPGVYFFKDVDNNILYIGRATSLRDRVRSYFGDDLIETRGPLLVDMVSKAYKIEYTETDSVLEAIILESNLIKEHQPYFNTKEKDNRSYNYVVITDEDFPRVMLVRGRTLEIVDKELLKFKIKEKFGPFPHGSLVREALRIIRKIFPFRDAKSTIPHQEAFYRSIGLSPDTSSIDSKIEYRKTVRNIILFFQGKKKRLMTTLEKEMKTYAKNMEFEKADEIKKTLYALTHIEDVSLIKEDSGKRNIHNTTSQSIRIEAYDIAHMSGKNTVGVMTVAYATVDNAEMEKSEYRKFRISVDKNNDTESMKELLSRRLTHTEWPIPDIMVVDGGINQRNIVEEIVNKLSIKTNIVSVVKNDKHKPEYFLGDEKLVKDYKDIILKANSEAHRFAIAYHKNLRKRAFLKS